MAEFLRPPALPVRRLSASLIVSLALCPEAARRQYVARDPRRPAPALARGTAVGATVGAALRAKARGAPLGDEDYELAYAAAWTEAASGSGVAVEHEEGEVGRRAALAWRTELLAETDLEAPDATEVRFEGRVLGVEVVGFADALLATGEVMELKSSGRAASELAAEWRVQSLVYAAAFRRPLVHHVAWPGGARRLPPIRPTAGVTAAGLSVIAWAAGELEDLARRYPAGPWPTWGIAHPWACKGCEWRGGCPAWRR